MKENKTVISACIDKAVYSCVQRIAQNMGISISEYLRRLIINDLDRRSFFTSGLKAETNA